MTISFQRTEWKSLNLRLPSLLMEPRGFDDDLTVVTGAVALTVVDSNRVPGAANLLLRDRLAARDSLTVG